jgi:hypothetical protein
MDGIVFIMFAALISMTTSLTFMEVRRIRKKMETQSETRTHPLGAKATTAQV